MNIKRGLMFVASAWLVLAVVIGLIVYSPIMAVIIATAAASFPVFMSGAIE